MTIDILCTYLKKKHILLKPFPSELRVFNIIVTLWANSKYLDDP